MQIQINEFMELNTCADAQRVVIMITDDPFSTGPLYNGLYTEMPIGYGLLDLKSFHTTHWEDVIVLNVGKEDVIETLGIETLKLERSDYEN